MQYEMVILELLTRIKKLEEDVEALKSEREEPSREDTKNAEHYKKVTREMIDMCYDYGKRFCDGGEAVDFADEISAKTGMNHSSAVMYIYAVRAMRKATEYKRAISAKATKIYFDKIREEFGKKGLKDAIEAAEKHIEYRKKCGQTVTAIEKLCAEAAESL